MRLSDLTAGLDIVNISGDVSREVAGVCYDSRMCREGSLFVAIQGLKVNGHDYIRHALERGAKTVVMEKETALPAEIASVRVRDSRRALGIIGMNFFCNPSRTLRLIGVTGTSGKTTTTFLLESIFAAAGVNVGVMGTINYRFSGTTMPAPNTTPESLDLQRILREMADAGVQKVVMEVSSHALELSRVDDCEFDIGVFTNLSPEHLDYHKTMEQYFLAKKRFFEEVLDGRKTGHKWRMIVNIDDFWGERLLSEVATDALTFAVDKTADITAGQIFFSEDGIDAVIRTPSELIPFHSALIGKFNLSNILAAAAAAYALGVPGNMIKTGIEKLRNIPGRLERVGEIGMPSVFVDYAHKEAALRGVLQNLSPFKKGRLITVFGCGGDRDRSKRPLMGLAAVTLSDLAILTSDNPRSENPMEIIREIEKGINSGAFKKFEKDILKGGTDKGYLVIPDRREAIEYAINIAHRKDIVLIAGKGHETYQIIGDNRIPFDDRAIAREALSARGNSWV